MASRPRTVNEWIRRYLKEEEPRSKSLIVTIFGDSLSLCGGSAWLGELIELLDLFAVNERLVRTSSFRLVEEGWLESQRDGRRSRYALTPLGARRFAHAYRRIYTPPPVQWDGEWTLVILPRPGNGAGERSELRRELEWEGFGQLAPGIFVHPNADPQALGEILAQLQLNQRATALRARDLPGVDSRPLAELTPEYWNLADVAASYRSFLQRFEPLLAVGREGFADEHAFVVQTLLMHSFRRVSLHDPRLPAELLPADWPGHAAYQLCRDLYGRTFWATHRYLRARLPDVPAKIPAEVLARFGGLSH